MVADYILRFLEDRRSFCSDRTLRYYTETLTRFNNWLKLNNIIYVHELNDESLLNYILYLRKTGIKNTSVANYYRAVKAFVKWLYVTKAVATDWSSGVKIPRSDAAIVIPLTTLEVVTCDRCFISLSENSLRNYCIFHLMLDCGLRRGEVLHLCNDDLIRHNVMRITNSKYNKSRLVLVPDFLEQSIINYINQNGCTSGCIFLDRYGRNPITEDTVRKMFFSLRMLTGINRLHPHLLRHTFATSYLTYGGNMEMLRLLLGHADYNITRTYLHLASQEQLLHSDLYRLDDIFYRKIN